MRKIVLVIGLWSITIFGLAQNRTSSQSGDWDQAATWGGLSAPDQTSGPFGTVTLNHSVTVRASVYNPSSPLLIDQVVINGTGSLIIEAGAAMRIQNGTGNDLTINSTGTITINGTLYTSSGVAFSGLTAANTSFTSSAELRASSVNIPTASGYDLIPVYLENVTAALTLGTSWSQLTATTDLEVNCPSLGNNAISFNGTITNLRTLQITSTNGASGGRVVLAAPGAGTTVTINIETGGLTVSNDSRLFISSGTTATSVVNLNLNGAFDFNSSVSGATGFSQVAISAGVTTVNFNNGNFAMGSGDLRFSPSGNNAIASFNFNSNSSMIVTAGTISELGGGSAQGNLNFLGNGTEQTLDIATSSIGTGTINLTVNKSSGNLNVTQNNTYATTTISSGDVNLLSGNSFTTSAFALNGGALSLAGASLSITTGNITGGAGIIDATTPSSLSIGGTGTASGTLLFSDNSIFTTFSLGRALTLANSPTTSSDIQIGTLTLTSGTLTKASGTISITDQGSITRIGGGLSMTGTVTALGVYDLTYNNTAALTTGAELSTSGTAIRNFTKQGTAALTLDKNLTVNGTYSHTAGTFNAGPTSPYAFSVTYNGGTNTISATENLGELNVNGPLTQSTATTTTITGNITIGVSGSLSFTSGTATFATGGNTAISNSGGSPVRFNNLTISGTLTAPSGTMRVSGNVSGNGTFNHNNGLVEFIGSTTITQAVKTYFNVTVNSGATLLGATGITIANNLTNNGTITFTGGTTTFSGSGQLTTSAGSPSTTFFNLTVSAGQTLTVSNFSNDITISSDITLNGNLNHTATNTIIIADDQLGTTGTLSSSGTIQFNGANSTFTGTASKTFTNLTVNTGAVLSVGANASYSVDGLLSVLGTLNAGTGTATVTFGNGGSGTAPSISGGGTVSVNNLTIAASHTLTSSSGTINVTGNFTNNGNFVHNNGTILFSTAGTKTISGSSASFNNLSVGNGTGNTTVTNSLSPLNLTGVLSINSTTVNTFNTGGANNFVLISTSDTPGSTNDEGSIGPITGSAVINGNFTMQRFVSSEGRVYRYISSPVNGANVAQWQDDFFVTGTFTGGNNGTTPGCTGCRDNPSSYYYGEDLGTPIFVAYPTPATPGPAGSNTDPLESGRGYSVFFRHDLNGPVTIDYSGSHVNTGAGITLPTANANGGFSLAGNPYPSPILWSATGFTKSNVSDIISVRDNPGGGIFRTFDFTIGNGIIAPGQAFWVQTTGATPSLVINENAKSSTQATFYRETISEPDQLIVYLKKSTSDTYTNGLTDEATIQLKEGTSALFDLGKDGINATNFSADNAIATQNPITGANTSVEVHDLSILSTDATPTRLSVQSIGSLLCNQVFKLHIKDLLNPAYSSLGTSAETSATYEFSIKQLGGLKAVKWKLFDAVTNQLTDLTSGTYSFPVTSNAALTDRFELRAEGVVVNTSAIPSLSSVSVCDGTEVALKISNSQLNVSYDIEIENSLGVKSFKGIAEGNGSTLTTFISNDILATGINQIRVKGNSGCDVQLIGSALSINKMGSLNTPVIASVDACKPGTYSLQVSDVQAGFIYQWFEGLNSTTILHSGSTYTTPFLDVSKTYYVTAVNENGCESNRLAVPVSIENPSVGIQVNSTATSVCPGNQVILNAVGTASDYRWYSGLSEMTTLGEGAQFQTPSIETTTTYFVAGINDHGCEGSRIPVTISIAAHNPTFTIVSDRTVYCLNSSVTLEATGTSTGSYQWFASETALAPVAEGRGYALDKITNDQTFWVSHVSDAGCVSPRKSIVLKVDKSNPSNISYQASKVCNQGSSMIELSGGASSLDFNWYAKETDSTPFGQGKKMQIDNLSSTASYWVAAVNEMGCEGQRIKVTAEVHKYPEAFITQESGRLISNFTSGNQWYLNGQPITGATASQIDIVQAGAYGLQVDVGQGCQSFTEKLISVITGVEKSWLAIYPNPSSGDDIYFEYWGNDVVQSARLLDMRGAVVNNFVLSAESNKITGKTSIRDLEKGLYILRVVTDTKVVAQKVIVE